MFWCGSPRPADFQNPVLYFLITLGGYLAIKLQKTLFYPPPSRPARLRGLRKRAFENVDPCMDPCMDPSMDPCMDPCMHPSIDPCMDPHFQMWVFPVLDVWRGGGVLFSNDFIAKKPSKLVTKTQN